MRNINKYLFLMILFLSMFSLVSAVPPVTTVSSFPSGYLIVEAQQEFLILNHDYSYHFYLYNASNGKNINDDNGVVCTFVMANNFGEILTYGNMSHINMGGYWEFNISGGNFSYVGEYAYGVNCQDGNGGALAGTFYITIDGSPNNLERLFSRIFLIMLIFTLIAYIKNLHGKTDFNKGTKKIIEGEGKKGQKMATGILYSLFKNSFVWIYFLGWFIVFILKDIVESFLSIEFYTYFELFANIYSLGLLLVVVYMIYYTIDYMKRVVGILTDNDWGVGDGE